MDQTKKQRIGIIGGGALGLTAGYRLIQKGYDVVVFEKAPDVGGLVTSLKIGPNYIEKFYHHIFKSDTVIWNLIKEVGLESKLEWKMPNTSTLSGGKVYRFDSPISVLMFSPLSIIDRVRVGIVTLYLKLQSNWKVFDGEAAWTWLQRWYGQRAFEVIWKPLLKSKFGAYSEKVVMSWFWSRIHNRTSDLGYVRGGFFQVYEKLGQLIKEQGGDVRLGQNVTALKETGEQVEITVNDKKELFDKIVVTVPTNLFFKLAPDLPKGYIDAHPPAPYYAAQNVVLEVNRQVSDVYWLNINDPGLPFLAFVEHTNFIPKEDYGGTHIIYLGNYYAQDDPNYLRPEEDVKKDYMEALKKINPEFDPSWVTTIHVFRTPFAQPIFTVGYSKQIPEFTTPFKNVFLANMSQIYPMDRGQNYSVKLAEEIVAKHF